MEDLRVEESLGVSLYVTDHFVDEILRLSTTCPNEDTIPTVNVGKNLVNGGELRRVRFSESA